MSRGGEGVSTEHYRVCLTPNGKGLHFDVFASGRPDEPLLSDSIANVANARQRAAALQPLEYPDEVERVLKQRAAITNGKIRHARRQPPSTDRSPYTDVANAERLVARHGADIRYCHRTREWFVYDGRRWALDEAGEMARRAKETARSIYAEAPRLEDLAERAAMAKHAIASERSARINAMIELAQSEPGIPIGPTEFDADPWLFNVSNGTIDLRTAELRPHRREDMISKLSPIVYDPNNTRCDRWVQFIEEIMLERRDLVGFLQRAIGYSLTGVTNEECLLFLYGDGANGKTKLLETLRLLLGEYAVQADFATFLERRHNDGPRPDVARLYGARLVTSSEVGAGKRLNEQLVKTLTGGDIVAARKLFKEAFEFEPTFKLWLSANDKPAIRGDDEGIWRRIRLVPFEAKFPEGQRDEQLLMKLKSELQAILSWAVAGCVLWQRNRLRAPMEVRNATQDYRLEMDPVSRFVDECCEVDEALSIQSRTLYRAFRRWLESIGEYAMSETKFAERIGKRFKGTKKGVVIREGIGLKAAFAYLGELSDSGGSGGSGGSAGIFTRSSSHVREFPEKAPNPPNPPDLEGQQQELAVR